MTKKKNVVEEGCSIAEQCDVCNTPWKIGDEVLVIFTGRARLDNQDEVILGSDGEYSISEESLKIGETPDCRVLHKTCLNKLVM